MFISSLFHKTIYSVSIHFTSDFHLSRRGHYLNLLPHSEINGSPSIYIWHKNQLRRYSFTGDTLLSHGIAQHLFRWWPVASSVRYSAIHVRPFYIEFSIHHLWNVFENYNFSNILQIQSISALTSAKIKVAKHVYGYISWVGCKSCCRLFLSLIIMIKLFQRKQKLWSLPCT